MRMTSTIIKPTVTEKSTSLAESGKYVFDVALDVNSGMIKKELKNIYGVDVTSVRVIVLPGKKRRKGNTPRFMKTAKRKKMIVTLKKGQKIDIAPKEAGK